MEKGTARVAEGGFHCMLIGWIFSYSGWIRFRFGRIFRHVGWILTGFGWIFHIFGWIPFHRRPDPISLRRQSPSIKR
ncbi:hypothetical protein [Rossellomorea vietnamensis]|uniref:hypothetical protein n=1 Tax=Rossellomorea vietnamensis TaxID=218284 RepID=UPI0012E7B936|nr:hypothetical protein [Rossellomorea vietnamensis]